MQVHSVLLLISYVFGTGHFEIQFYKYCMWKGDSPGRVSCITPECQSCLYSSATFPYRVHKLWWLQGLCLKENKKKTNKHWPSWQGMLLVKATVKSGCEHTGTNFGAQPSLNAFLVDVLQTACTAARLNQGVGCWFFPHLADSAQIPFFLIRILQQQSIRGWKFSLTVILTQ